MTYRDIDLGLIKSYIEGQASLPVQLSLHRQSENTAKLVIVMVKVKVEQGWLCGEQLETFQGDGPYYSFKGIPYAEPPIGILRFKAPRPPLPWDGVRKAIDHGSKCPQVDLFRPEKQPNNEDCLYLNVYTPQLVPVSPLPVMVFIHGGLFKTGSGDFKNYGPDFLVPHGVVFVTINHRLEVLGYLCLDSEEVPGNAGMKDQVAALKWIKNNISNFGGDPNNVTIIGHNSGSVSAALHIFSPMSKGLFKRVICLSGVPFCDWATPFEPQKRAFTLGKQLGLDTDDPKVLLNYLQKIPVEKLINTNPTILSFEEHNNYLLNLCHFPPVIEKDYGQERFLTEDVLKTLKNTQSSDIDVLMGHTSQEAILEISVFEKNLKSLLESYNRYPEKLVPRKIQIMCTPIQTLEVAKRIHNYYFKEKQICMDTLKEFITYLSHTGFEYDINSFASKLSKYTNGRLYMYKFSCTSSRNIHGNKGLKYNIEGASHIDDGMYITHAKLYNLKLDKNTREYELVRRVCTLYTNFAKYGNPTPDSSFGVTWPEYDSITKCYADIGDTLTLGTNPLGDTFEFWRSIYNEVELEY